MALVGSLTSIVNTHNIPDAASSVPTFYAPKEDSDDDDTLIPFIIILPLVTAIFGAVHLIAWGFHFPSNDEQLLWRIGSLTMTTFPLLALAFVLCTIIFLVIVKLLKLVDDKFGIRFPASILLIPEDSVVVELMIAIGVFLGGAGLVVSTLQKESASSNTSSSLARTSLKPPMIRKCP